MDKIDTFFASLNGKRVAFIGAGVSHKICIELFCKCGANVTLCDQKNSVEDFGDYASVLTNYGVHLSLGEKYLDGLKNQDMIMRTPGFEFYTKELQDARNAGSEVTSEMQLFFELCPCKIFAITGSDGKTTTTTLIAEILKKSGYNVHLGGNLGRALLPVVRQISETDVAVVELSSFQLISMHAPCEVAVVTNVTPNHLDHHKDMQEYIDAKRNILKYQPKNSLSVLGYENDISRGMQKDVKGEGAFFSRIRIVGNGAFLREDGMLCLIENRTITPIMHRSEIALRGEHNIENVLAAFTATRRVATTEDMAQVAKSFAGVEHRIEPVRKINGIMFYNDSIATSPTRVIAGLRAFSQRLIIIAGGYDKNVPFEPMANDVATHVKTLILIGDTAQKISDAVTSCASYNESELSIVFAKNLADAVQIAFAYAKDGDIVSLSPACASFDSYANFEERGVEYKRLVNAL